MRADYRVLKIVEEIEDTVAMDGWSLCIMNTHDHKEHDDHILMEKPFVNRIALNADD